MLLVTIVHAKKILTILRMSPIGGFLCLIRSPPVDFNCIFIDSFQDGRMIPTLISIVYKV